jgi:hypothetical protein
MTCKLDVRGFNDAAGVARRSGHAVGLSSQGHHPARYTNATAAPSRPLDDRIDRYFGVHYRGETGAKCRRYFSPMGRPGSRRHRAGVFAGHRSVSVRRLPALLRRDCHHGPFRTNDVYDARRGPVLARRAHPTARGRRRWAQIYESARPACLLLTTILPSSPWRSTRTC